MKGKIVIKWIRNAKYYLLRLLRSKSSNHKIALGFAAGFVQCWFPTFGLGPILSAAVSKLLRANMLASLVGAGIGALIWPLLFYWNYVFGALLTGIVKAAPKEELIADLEDIQLEDVGYIEAAEQVHSWKDAGIDFLVGAVANSILSLVVGYVVVRLLLAKFKEPLLALFKKKRGRSRVDRK